MSKFYVVWIGRQPGIYSTWKECSAQVHGYRGARYQAFRTLAEARIAFAKNYDIPKMDEIKASRSRHHSPRPPTNGWCVDASCIGNPGPVEYQCVQLPDGRRIFRRGPYSNGTNNIGEFLAIVDALRRLMQLDDPPPLYTDSAIAILWVRKKKCNTRISLPASNSPLLDLIVDAEAWLRSNEITIPIHKWKTDVWGENPADFLRK